MKIISALLISTGFLFSIAMALPSTSASRAYSFISYSSSSDELGAVYAFIGPLGLAADGKYYPLVLTTAELKKEITSGKTSDIAIAFKESFCTSFGLTWVSRLAWVPTEKGETYITGIMAQPQTQKNSSGKYGRVISIPCHTKWPSAGNGAPVAKPIHL